MATTAAIECIAFRRQQSIILFSCNRILGRGANSRPNQNSLKSIVHSSSLYKLAAILLFIVYHNNLKLCLSRKNVYRIGMHVTKILHSCVFQMCGFDIHNRLLVAIGATERDFNELRCYTNQNTFITTKRSVLI